MDKVNRYEFEGEVIEVPVRWDDNLQREAEDYTDYCKQPGHTPSGRPILFTFDDACAYAEMVDNEPTSVECSTCRYFRHTPGSLLGVCHNEKMRSGAKIQDIKFGAEEE